MTEKDDLLAPVRVQLSRRKGWRMPPNTVVVARPSRWGNPWTIEECGEAAEAVRMFRARLPGAPLFLEPAPDSYMGRIIADLHLLRGKNLACWCALDQPCHADILLYIANDWPEPLMPAEVAALRSRASLRE